MKTRTIVQTYNGGRNFFAVVEYDTDTMQSRTVVAINGVSQNEAFRLLSIHL